MVPSSFPPVLPPSPQVVGQVLRSRLRQSLPGLDAQMVMAPSIRKREESVPPSARLSAVLILLYPRAGQWFLPFMRRTDDGRVHSGQVCFPGGRYEAQDPDYTFTALRETQEELGISPPTVEVLGALTELYIPPSNSLVFPRLGLLPARPAFVPAPDEVAEVIEVPLLQLFEPQRRGLHRVTVHAGWEIEAPGFTFLDDCLIWGGTAMMLAELAALLSDIPEFVP